MSTISNAWARTLALVAAMGGLALSGCGGGDDAAALATPTKASVADGPAASPAPTLGQMVAVPGATVVGLAWLDSHTAELTVASNAFVAPVKVEVMLPAGYLTDTRRRWASTYYLGGTNHDQTTFRKDYSAYDLVQAYPSLVVSPSGNSGYWSDWFNNGAGGPPRYETFVIQQLMPLIDANFRTLADRAQRAVMGDSMGGYGALMLAARHPDLFGAAASLSGTVDTNFPTGAAAVSVSPLLQTSAPDAVYGPRLTQEVRWRGHNPWDLARNLRGVDLQVFTGNGLPGVAQGEGPIDLAGCAVEAGAIQPESVNLHNRLNALGIAHAWVPLDWGCHSVSLFRHEIALAVARFQQVFALAPAAPTAFDFQAIEPRFSVYGWSVEADPARALEFLSLRDVSAAGLTLVGSGQTRVTTPALFRGQKTVDVAIDGVVKKLRPDAAGRLAFTVDLGPANAQQAYSLGSVNDAQIRQVRFTPR